MHDAMSDNIDLAGILQDSRSSLPQHLQHAFHCSPAVRRGYVLIQHGSACGLYVEVRRVSRPFDFCAPKRIGGVGWWRIPNFIERAFLAAGAGIQDQNFHQYFQVQSRISGMSSPNSRMYCLCCTNLLRRDCLK